MSMVDPFCYPPTAEEKLFMAKEIILRLKQENEQLRKDMRIAAERILRQSELLSKKAERKSNGEEKEETKDKSGDDEVLGIQKEVVL